MNDSMLVCGLHRHSDIEICNVTGNDVYHIIGHNDSLRSSKGLLTVNKTMDLKRFFALRGRAALKEL
jgi:hypothetical protein